MEPSSNETGSVHDYTVLKMGAIIDEWLEIMERTVMSVCSSANVIIKLDSK